MNADLAGWVRLRRPCEIARRKRPQKTFFFLFSPPWAAKIEMYSMELSYGNQNTNHKIRRNFRR